MIEIPSRMSLILAASVLVFVAGEPRKRLRRYLPGLHALIQKGRWVSGDSRRWATEDEARAELLETLQTLAELM